LITEKGNKEKKERNKINGIQARHNNAINMTRKKARKNRNQSSNSSPNGYTFSSRRRADPIVFFFFISSLLLVIVIIIIMIQTGFALNRAPVFKMTAVLKSNRPRMTTDTTGYGLG